MLMGGCPSHAISCIARDVHGVDHERLLIPLGTSWDIGLYLMLMGHHDFSHIGMSPYILSDVSWHALCDGPG